MLEPTTPSSWRQSLDLPSRLFGQGEFGGNDYELYEEDGEFVLSVDVPGFEREEIDLTWNDGVLEVTLPIRDTVEPRGEPIPIEG